MCPLHPNEDQQAKNERASDRHLQIPDTQPGRHPPAQTRHQERQVQPERGHWPLTYQPCQVQEEHSIQLQPVQ